MIPVVVGSNPISHPILPNPLSAGFLFSVRSAKRFARVYERLQVCEQTKINPSDDARLGQGLGNGTHATHSMESDVVYSSS